MQVPRLLLICSFVTLTVIAQTPRLLPFQARITDQNGKAMSDGANVVQFQIFADPIGGSPLWAGEVHRLTINGGIANVVLGTKSPFPANRTNEQGATLSFFDATLYLEVTVDSAGKLDGSPDGNITKADPPLLPRQALIPVPFASESARSRDSEKLQGRAWNDLASDGPTFQESISGTKIRRATLDGDRLINGSVEIAKLSESLMTRLIPAGTVVAFAGETPPSGWWLCDGRIVSRAEYPELFTAIGVAWGNGDSQSTFHIPDLRGIFLRGVDHGRGFDPDANSRLAAGSGNSGDRVGSVQGDEFTSHSHVFDDYYWSERFGPLGDVGARGSNGGATDGDNGPMNVWQHATVSAGGLETRPKNANVNYIIKY